MGWGASPDCPGKYIIVKVIAPCWRRDDRFIVFDESEEPVSFFD